MNRIPPKLYVQLPLAAVFLAGLFVVSCATMPTERPASVGAAQEAIANAERVEAARYAAGELGAARTRLASAEVAVNEKKIVLADRFADNRKVDTAKALAETSLADRAPRLTTVCEAYPNGI